MVVADPMHTIFLHYTVMALSRLFFTAFLLLFSLLILASASDYSYNSTTESYVSVPKPELDNSKSKDQGYSPKSSEDQQSYGSKPDTEESKPQDYKNDSKPQPNEENGYDSKADSKPQPNEENDQDSKPQPEEEHDQDSKPEYKPQPSKENGDDSKPKDYKPQPKEEHGQDSKPDVYKPQPEKSGYDSKPTDQEPDQHGSKPVYNDPKSEEKGNPTCIEGLVFCKSGSKYIPVKGAVVRITCQVVGDDDECETVYSNATDANGYFFKTLSTLKLTDGLKLKECKAFLEDSPMEKCKIPTDVNGGIRGALLNSYRILDHNNIKLFRVGPFFYTSESQYSDPNNGY